MDKVISKPVEKKPIDAIRPCVNNILKENKTIDRSHYNITSHNKIIQVIARCFPSSFIAFVFIKRWHVARRGGN